jgi:2-oxoglutarate dehydrogenase E2 component (dihydrolipoamide succinyltransferase)
VRWASTKLKIPFLGDSVTEGVLKMSSKVGDWVTEDQTLGEVESDKTSQPINAPFAGKIVNILVADGKHKCGTDVIEIEAGEAPAGEGKKADAPKQADEPKAAKKEESKAAEPAAAKKPAQAQPTTQARAQAGGVTRIQMTPMRKAIARRMMESKENTAMLTTFQEINMTKLMALRNANKDGFEKKHAVKLGLMSPFVKAAATALMEFPMVNASIEGEEIVQHDYADIAVAVATPTGLVVPVIRDCQNKTFADIEKDIAEYAARARKNRITPQDMQGGTFTISNGGTFGSLFGTPILNPPQSAILGMHAIFKRPVVDEKDNIVVAQMMVVALTYDHRIIDGRDAVTFLVRIKELIEDPARFAL